MNPDADFVLITSTPNIPDTFHLAEIPTGDAGATLFLSSGLPPSPEFAPVFISARNARRISAKAIVANAMANCSATGDEDHPRYLTPVILKDGRSGTIVHIHKDAMTYQLETEDGLIDIIEWDIAD